jgi:hypothetical protein
MLLDKIKVMAQVIGFICIGLLAIYGGVVAATGGPPAWAAGAAAPAAPEAITPALISYQGTLRDAGDNLANGTYNMVVKICPDEDCASQLWSETHSNVEVREGHFNLLLGEDIALSREDFVDPSLYIELTVEGQVMTPRQRFAAVPYAIAATYATTLSAPDGDPAEAVTVDNAGNVSVGDGSTSADVEIPMGGLCIDSDGACGSPGDGGLRVGEGGIHGTDSSSDDLYLVPSTGKVGIGKSDPQNELDVNGSASVSGNLGVGTTSPDQKLSVIGTVRGADTVDETDYTEIGHGGTNGYINTVGTGDLDFRHDGNTKMSLNDAGDLDVVGNVDADSLTIDGSKPIFFKKFIIRDHNYFHYISVWSASDWACGIVSIRANGNLNENYSGDLDLFRAQTYTDGGVWHVYGDFPNEDGTEDWDVTVMCIDADMVEWKPDYSW